MLVRHEQRPAPLERDTDLRARETSGPIPDQPPDRAGDATVIEHKVGNGRDARGVVPLSGGVQGVDEADGLELGPGRGAACLGIGGGEEARLDLDGADRGGEPGHLWDGARERRRRGSLLLLSLLLLLPLLLLPLLLLVEAARGREHRPAAALQRHVQGPAGPLREGARPGPADEGKRARRGVLLRARGRLRFRGRRGRRGFREGSEGRGIEEGGDRGEGLRGQLGPVGGLRQLALFFFFFFEEEEEEEERKKKKGGSFFVLFFPRHRSTKNVGEKKERKRLCFSLTWRSASSSASEPMGSWSGFFSSSSMAVVEKRASKRGGGGGCE